jgi:sec-independent protein translocase protein TatB
VGLQNLDTWHLVVVALIGLFIFGPDRLPKAIADGLRMLRQLRGMANEATRQLSEDLGTELSPADLHPKALIRKHLLSEDDEAALRAPFRQVVDDLQATADAIDPATAPPTSPAGPAANLPAAEHRRSMYTEAT